MNNAKLAARLRAANPVVLNQGTNSRNRSFLRRLGQSISVILAVLVLGAGVSWAASGENPFASVFSQDLEVNDSPVGFDSFDALRPATQHDLDSLPGGIALSAAAIATKNTGQTNQEQGLPPLGEPGSTEPFRPDPAAVSAIGHVESNVGSPVTLLVIDDEICAYEESGFSSQICGREDDIDKGLAIGVSTGDTSSQSQIFGLVSDDVVEVQVSGDDGSRTISVPDNVFQLTRKSASGTVTGLSDSGEVLFRTPLPEN